MAVRVLHLVGSAVNQFYDELSQLYARDCLVETADVERYSVLIAHVRPGGAWCFPVDLTAAGVAAAPSVTLPEALTRISSWAPDVMVPQMFCRPGMTGYRALFDVLGVPYPGNPPEVMALGADKARARAVVASAGVDVPDGVVVEREDEAGFSGPVVVKPVDADNSLGVSLVRSSDELSAAVRSALAHSRRALVERYVELGREVRCGILERDGTLIGLPLEEYRVDPVHKPVRGHDDKIRRDLGGLSLVAKDEQHAWIVDPGDPVTESVWRAARICHRALGCRDYSLFDFRIDPGGRPWFLEASLYNSFAPSSVISTMAAAAGTSLRDLFSDAVRSALNR